MKTNSINIKRIVITFSVLFIIVFAVIQYIRITYQDHIIRILQNYANKNLETEILIAKKNIRFHILQTFPNASVQLKDILIKSSDTFNSGDFDEQNTDTLLFAEKIFLEFDLVKLLNKQYELKELSIENGICNIFIDKEKNNNYSVWKEDTTETKVFKIELDKIKLASITLNYTNKFNQTKIHSTVQNHLLKGSIEEKDTELLLNGECIIHSVVNKGDILFTDKTIHYDLTLFSDTSQINLLPGKINLDGIELDIEGKYIKAPSQFIQLTMKTENSSIGTLANKLRKEKFNIGKLQFSRGKASISISLEGHLKKDFPKIHTHFIIKNGMARYNAATDLKLENIYFRGSASMIKSMKKINWKINIDSLNMLQGKSRYFGSFDLASYHRKTLSCNIKGIVYLPDLHNITNALPFKCDDGKARMQIIIANTNPDMLNSTQKVVKAIHYGKVVLRQSSLNINDYSGLFEKIEGSVYLKDNTLIIDSLNFIKSNDDISFTGKLSDFDQIFSSEQGRLELSGYLKSNNIHFYNWTNSDTGNEKTGIFPKNMDISVKSNIRVFHIKEHQYNNVICSINYTPYTWEITNMKLNTAKGECTGNAILKYTPNEDLTFQSSVNFSEIDIHNLFAEYKNFSQNAIVSDNLNGSVWGDVNLHWKMTPDFNISLSSIRVNGNLTIKNGELLDYKPLYRLSRFIDIDELSHLNYKKFTCFIRIQDETVYFEDLYITSPDFTITGKGMHTFSNVYEYKIQPELSELLTKKAKRNKKVEFGNVIDDGLGKITIPLIISGKSDDIKIVYDKKHTASTFRQRINEERNTLREIFTGTQRQENNVQEKDTTTASETQENNNTSNGFTIEWDDSEDED